MKLLRGPSEAPASRRGEGPPCVCSHFSVCLIISLCLHWHRPVCFFLPHCESGFICAVPGTNYFNEMNVNWRAKHSLVFCLAENTCCITKHQLCITRSLQENSGDKETTGYPNQTCTCTKWDSVQEHEGSLSQEIDAGVQSDLEQILEFWKVNYYRDFLKDLGEWVKKVICLEKPAQHFPHLFTVPVNHLLQQPFRKLPHRVC